MPRPTHYKIYKILLIKIKHNVREKRMLHRRRKDGYLG
jgi:hypothetical protein